MNLTIIDGRNPHHRPSSSSPSSTDLTGASSSSPHRRTPGTLKPVLSVTSVFPKELIFGVFLVVILSLASGIYVRYKLRDCQCSEIEISKGNSSPKDENPKALNFRRAKIFTYEELARASAGFKDESIVGRGSFSCVFKGVLKDGTVVAVKRAIMSSDLKKNSKEFHTELDLLSRLNHAHLLNLLGYCEEGRERLLVYEFMAHGSLHQHIHGSLKSQLDWVRRVTIAVQASRGIEYLHGYAGWVGATLIWDFVVLGWEVSYKEKFVPTDEGSYTIIIQKEKKLDSVGNPIRNSFRNNEPGKIVLTIVNHSKKKKRVFYRHNNQKTACM